MDVKHCQAGCSRLVALQVLPGTSAAKESHLEHRQRLAETYAYSSKLRRKRIPARGCGYHDEVAGCGCCLKVSCHNLLKIRK
jgi:hypothetical protein